MISQAEIWLYSRRQHCILKTTRYLCIPLEKDAVVYEIIMAIILQVFFSVEFLCNAVSHIICRSIYYYFNFITVGCHMPQKKKANFLLYLSTFYCTYYCLQMVLKNSCILRHRIVVVLQFHNSEITGACYLFEMVGDLIELIMLSFLMLCLYSFFCVTFISICSFINISAQDRGHHFCFYSICSLFIHSVM